jgi:hypothetical protein
MTRRVQSYWTSTGIVAGELVLGGITGALRGRTALVAGPRTVDVLARLGYPDYLLEILFPWRILGAIVLLAPGFRRLKEWVYAGVVFELTGAIASHTERDDLGLDTVGWASFVLACALVSWALRPASRSLGA